MRRRILFTVSMLAGTLLLAASTAASSEPFKRYTLPAGSQKIEVPNPADKTGRSTKPYTTKPYTPGTLVVLLPAAWRLRTYDYGTWARDPLHRTVRWSVGSRFEPVAQTLGGIRRHQVAWFGHARDIWGPNTGTAQQVGDSFLNLPIGKVWRQTLEIIPPAGNGGWAARSYARTYWLDRGIVRAYGIERHLYLTLYATCGHRQCAAHNGQLATIMASIRFIR